MAYRKRWDILFGCGFAMLLAANPIACLAAEMTYSDIESSNGETLVFAAQVDGALVDLEMRTVPLDLTEIELVTVSEEGSRRVPFPKLQALRGAVRGDPDSRVTLSVDEEGDLRGTLSFSGGVAGLEGRLATPGDPTTAGVGYRLAAVRPSPSDTGADRMCAVDGSRHEGE